MPGSEDGSPRDQYVSSVTRDCPESNSSTKELVLAVLLDAFSFEKSNEIIDWKLGITLTPYVRGQENRGPQVPVKVNIL